MSFITAFLISRLVGRRHIGTVDCQVFWGASDGLRPVSQPQNCEARPQMVAFANEDQTGERNHLEKEFQYLQASVP